MTLAYDLNVVRAGVLKRLDSLANSSEEALGSNPSSQSRAVVYGAPFITSGHKQGMEQPQLKQRASTFGVHDDLWQKKIVGNVLDVAVDRPSVKLLEGVSYPRALRITGSYGSGALARRLRLISVEALGGVLPDHIRHYLVSEGLSVSFSTRTRLSKRALDRSLRFEAKQWFWLRTTLKDLPTRRIAIVGKYGRDIYRTVFVDGMVSRNKILKFSLASGMDLISDEAEIQNSRDKIVGLTSEVTLFACLLDK